MAKKTPSKSTTKKKAAAKKKAAPKKSDAVKTNPKKTVAKKETAKTTKKKTPSKKPVKKKENAKTPAKKESAEKPAKKAATTPKKKAVSIPELLQLKFESWQPEKMFTVAPDETFQQGFTAPPAVDTTDKKEADRISALLNKTFDLTIPDVKKALVAEKPEPPTLKEKPIDESKAGQAVAEPEVPPAEPVKKEVKAKPELEKKPAPPAEIETKKVTPEEPSTAAKTEPEKPVVETEQKPEKPAVKKVEEEKPPEPVKAEEKKTPAKPPAQEKPAPPQPMQKETPPSIPPAPAAAMEKPEPENQALKMLIGCIAGIFALLIIASAMNTNNYYLKPTKNALEIWKGNFSPNGKELIMSVPGATIPEPIKSEYNRAEALLFAFNYYIAKADAVAGEKTIKGYDAALKHLKQATGFTIDKSQKEKLANKINAIKAARDKLIKKTEVKPKKS